MNAIIKKGVIVATPDMSKSLSRVTGRIFLKLLMCVLESTVSGIKFFDAVQENKVCFGYFENM
jgi:hypothetical protein